MGSNIVMDARLDIHAREVWELQRAAFFDVRVFHPNADCYRDKELDQIYRDHENEKRRLYSRRTLDIAQGTFTPLVFSSTGGMGKECVRFYSRLAKLLAAKKGESYSTTISWITARTSFELLRSLLVCLRGSRSRNFKSVIGNIDLDIANAQSCSQIKCYQGNRFIFICILFLSSLQSSTTFTKFFLEVEYMFKHDREV